MTEDRPARCCRALGYRRWRVSVLAAFAFAVPAALVGSAAGATGGVGLRTTTSHRVTARAAQANPFGGRAMWIWVVADSSGGSLPAIVATAHQYGIRTLIIKSGDGPYVWSQFSRQLVSGLHAGGLRVCAWQYLYGAHPISEAFVGAAAVRAGANCLLIDAESEYETQANSYVQAQTYIAWLRKLIGARFPVALAGLPYIDFHPAFPYSVFLGPGGAQYNVPQMYWKEIGVGVDTVYAHTYAFNRLYRRPIAPLGQVYDSPPLRQIVRFRQISRVYHAPGVSWWDWQEASPQDWTALSQPAGSLTGVTASPTLATIASGSRGDLVVWAQEHLVTAGYQIPVDGGYGPATLFAVESFQSTHGLTVDGVTGTATWGALLRYAPAHVHWTRAGARIARSARFSLTMPVPKSSRLPAKRDEIAGAGGAGWPTRR